MSEENKQAVVDVANTQAKPGSEAESARTDAAPDLETILADYDRQIGTTAAGSPSPQQVTDTAPPEYKALAAEVQSMRGQVQEFAQVKFKQDMGVLIKDVRGDFDSNIFDDELVESWINAQAIKDPRLQQAWAQRDANPRQFRQIAAGLGKAFKQKFDKLPDRNATEDREAVAAAVRGASTRAPEDRPPNYSGMSNAEYRKEVREKYGFDPGV